MNDRVPSKHRQPVAASRPATANVENELDSLISKITIGDENQVSGIKLDPIEQLRERILREFTPILHELNAKYAPKGISIRMDASRLLQGGRELDFEFAAGDYRTRLHGTVTNEAIGFEQIRYTPQIDGELDSGPLLRLRQLNADTFRAFVCERVVLLLKGALRRT
ncbi:MAG: hypothetical protein AABZ47_08420 [Planctomycetota bacterium]